jgi:hypothetical protein
MQAPIARFVASGARRMLRTVGAEADTFVNNALIRSDE